MKHQTGRTGWPSGNILVQTNCLDIHYGMEDVLQVCAWQPFLPSYPDPLPFPPLEVGPLLQVGGPGSALAPPAGPGGARPPNDIW